MTFDILSIPVITIDIFTIGFILWRILDKKATLWGASRFIYWWIAVLTLYHAGVYTYTLFIPAEASTAIIFGYLHPVVALFVLNPLLIIVIHYRGGHL